jgi:hypothetical protein
VARNRATRLRWDQTAEKVRNLESGRCWGGKPAQRSPGLISPKGNEPHGRCLYFPLCVLRDDYVSTWSSWEATHGSEGLPRVHTSVRKGGGLEKPRAELQSLARLRSSPVMKNHSMVSVASATCDFGRKGPCGEPSLGSIVRLRPNDAESRWKRGVETPADECHLWRSSTDQNLRVGDGTLVQRLRGKPGSGTCWLRPHPTGRSNANLRGRKKANWQCSRPNP